MSADGTSAIGMVVLTFIFKVLTANALAGHKRPLTRLPQRAATRSWSNVAEASVGQRRRSLQTIWTHVVFPAGAWLQCQPIAVPKRCPMP